MYRAAYHSPIGWINIETTEWSLIALYFTSHPYENPDDYPLIQAVVRQLEEYFKGQLTQFELPLDPPGTVFQRSVWEEVMKIPYGQTLSYNKLASRLGDENKVRAVASANAANVIALVIPCHRVIGSRGELTGYAWGLDRKEWLLHHEQHQSQLRLF